MLTAEALSEFYRRLGRRVRDARIEAGLSQAALADALQLTRSSVANLEGGRQRIQAHTLVTLAKALAVDPQSLLPEEESISDPRSTVPSSLQDGASFESESARRFVENSLANTLALREKQ
ncbi:helix-turn-helix domain-containing protein [Actinomycetospora sp. C-140]